MSTVLEQLRKARITAFMKGDKVRLRGQQLPPEIVEYARRNKAQLIADLAEEEAAHDYLKCPQCGIVDYEPLGDRRRRCYGCGNEWALK